MQLSQANCSWNLRTTWKGSPAGICQAIISGASAREARQRSTIGKENW